MADTRTINAQLAPAAAGGYSQGLLIENFERVLLVSGQIPVGRDGHVPECFEAQARLVWANVCAQLAEAGMTVANLVKVTTFLSSREHADVNGAVRRTVLGEHAPALTVVICGIYDERWLLEIEAVAVS